ncbi:MAG: DUF502 domain-containing protein [Rhodospirillales bacterium]
MSQPSASSPEPARRLLRLSNLGLAARLRAYLLTGILVTAPISITIYIAWALIAAVDDMVSRLLPTAYNPGTYLPLWVPGIGVLLVAVVLILIGWFAAGYVGRLFVRLGEAALARVPVVRSLYSATKQILETVFANQSQAFREVALLEYPRRGVWTLGFVTGAPPAEVVARTGEDLVVVFVPTAPNPTGGFVLFVPRGDLQILSMSVEEGIKMVVSGGLVTPPARPVEAAAPAVPEPAHLQPERR